MFTLQFTSRYINFESYRFTFDPISFVKFAQNSWQHQTIPEDRESDYKKRVGENHLRVNSTLRSNSSWVCFGLVALKSKIISPPILVIRSLFKWSDTIIYPEGTSLAYKDFPQIAVIADSALYKGYYDGSQVFLIFSHTIMPSCTQSSAIVQVGLMGL